MCSFLNSDLIFLICKKPRVWYHRDTQSLRVPNAKSITHALRAWCVLQENQIYSADERRALAMFHYEEHQKKENKVCVTVGSIWIAEISRSGVMWVMDFLEGIHRQGESHWAMYTFSKVRLPCIASHSYSQLNRWNNRQILENRILHWANSSHPSVHTLLHCNTTDITRSFAWRFCTTN